MIVHFSFRFDLIYLVLGSSNILVHLAIGAFPDCLRRWKTYIMHYDVNKRALTILSSPISSMISIVDPSAVAKSKHPFIKNFMLPVPDGSWPAVLQVEDNYASIICLSMNTWMYREHIQICSFKISTLHLG